MNESEIQLKVFYSMYIWQTTFRVYDNRNQYPANQNWIVANWNMLEGTFFRIYGGDTFQIVFGRSAPKSETNRSDYRSQGKLGRKSIGSNDQSRHNWWFLGGTAGMLPTDYWFTNAKKGHSHKVDFRLK